MKVHNDNRENLKGFKIDCSKCSGLCCTALFFSKTEGFPENKAGGTPCKNLNGDFTCKIHNELGKRNMKGCIGYDCFGAGQFVTEEIYNGASWKSLKGKEEEIFQVFIIIFQLHQIRYFLEEAKTLTVSEEYLAEIEKLIEENKVLCSLSPSDILKTDVELIRNKSNAILKKVSSKLINSFGKKTPQIRDFLGKNFKGRDLSGVDLSMKLLIAANFDGCKFNGTQFLGADTRDTNFSNCDLRESVFLTQGQINSAKGNRNTKLPTHLSFPLEWVNKN